MVDMRCSLMVVDLCSCSVCFWSLFLKIQVHRTLSLMITHGVESMAVYYCESW